MKTLKNSDGRNLGKHSRWEYTALPCLWTLLPRAVYSFNGLPIKGPVDV